MDADPKSGSGVNPAYNKLSGEIYYHGANYSERQGEGSKPGCFTRVMKWVAKHPFKSLFITAGVLGVTSGAVSAGVILGLGAGTAALSDSDITVAPNVTNYLTNTSTNFLTNTSTNFSENLKVNATRTFIQADVSTTRATTVAPTTQAQNETETVAPVTRGQNSTKVPESTFSSTGTYRAAFCDKDYYGTWHYCCEDTVNEGGYYFMHAPSTGLFSSSKPCPGHEDKLYPGESKCSENDRAELYASMNDYCRSRNKGNPVFTD